jgi:hypothetical protein
MADRLTQRLIYAAEIPAKWQVLNRDGELIGFALRVIGNGCKTWFCDIRIRGMMRRITIAWYPDLSVKVVPPSDRMKDRAEKGGAKKLWAEKLYRNRNPARSKKMNQKSAGTNLGRGEATTAFSTKKRNYRQTSTEVYFK